jgi:hypothetical protein
MVALVSFLAESSCRAMETNAMAGSGARPIPPWLLSMTMYGMISVWLTIGSFVLRRREYPLLATRCP